VKTAGQPFQFVTASYLTRIGNQKANDLEALREGLEYCSDASIFYHTFQSLGRHHFLTEGFSNDFAQWVLAGCNRAELAEHLASLDIRDYLSLAELRADLRRVVTDYCTARPAQAHQAAFEPFYFCESIEVKTMLGAKASTLEQFRSALDHLSHASFHYHFIASRLRLQLRTNDFSQWFAAELGLDTMAKRAERIDIYTNTVETAKDKLIALVDREMSS
jgi:hypothetical protein